MTSSQSKLSFNNPPLKEVSFSIQFEPISSFHIGFIGLLWDKYRDRYPKVETAEEATQQIEKFGIISRKQPPFPFKFIEETPVPRTLFVSADAQHVIQIQKDRFIFNWRKIFDENLRYPRYSNVKKKLFEEFEVFTNFLTANGLESPRYNQVEVIYVNHIDANIRSIDSVFVGAVGESQFSSSLNLEAFSINLKHVIQRDSENIGRLYTSINKASRISDGVEIYDLKFIVRLNPNEPSIAGVMDAMDIARMEINSSFEAVTTKEMHDEWNREDSKS